MKILTLNKSQQKKLLALYKEFFPELQLGDDPEDNLSIGIVQMQWMTKTAFTSHPEVRYSGTVIYENYDIHWYQLCLTELPKRIQDKLNQDYQTRNLDIVYKNRRVRNDLEIHILAYDVHPVDFLHSFVKDCHKNKYFKHGT